MKDLRNYDTMSFPADEAANALAELICTYTDDHPINVIGHFLIKVTAEILIEASPNIKEAEHFIFGAVNDAWETCEKRIRE